MPKSRNERDDRKTDEECPSKSGLHLVEFHEDATILLHVVGESRIYFDQKLGDVVRNE